MICTCGAQMIGVEYAPGSKFRYDGVSEYDCPKCLRRVGRWCGHDLKEGEIEKRDCDGNYHTKIFDIEQGGETNSNAKEEV